MNKIDTESLKSRIDISSIIGQYVKIQKNGNGFVALCPFHDDSAPSMHIHPREGYYKCHGCGKGGDVISFVQDINHISFTDAIKKLSGEQTAAVATQPDDKKYHHDEQVIPVPPGSPDVPKIQSKLINGTWVEYPITHFWPYKSPIGELLGYVIRYETPEGKVTPTLTMHQDKNNNLKWRAKGFPAPRPLMHLDILAHNPVAQVIIVEGEKCCEILQETLPAGIVVTTWPGGSRAVNKADFSSLVNRKIVLWPDADEPGKSAMLEISDILRAQGCSVKIINVTDKPAGWDCADAILQDGWAAEQCLSYIRDNLVDPPAAPEKPKPPAKTEKPTSDPQPQPEPEQNIPESSPFRCLGFNSGFYYYLPSGTSQVTVIRTADHSQKSLLGLAPIRYWEDNFPGEKGPSWNAACNTLLRTCEKRGIYDTTKQRGRGAWYDSGRSVLHLGDRLIVDGKTMSIDAIDSRYIYEAGSQLEYEHAKPATRDQAHRLREIVDMLFWEREIYATYLSGWIAIAPICGALSHRPHVWITGSAGTGKTHVLDNIVRPILDNFCLPVQSETTSAGVRQALGCDAIPVMLDEFEGEDFSGQERVQKMLELARQAFSDTSARIIKGGQSGKPSYYNIRSCFLMSSIAVNISKAADASRIMVLSLAKPHDTKEKTKEQHFTELCRITSEVISESWAASFRARSIAMIPIIRQNTEIFAEAVSIRVGNRRAGDQIGPLLAGAFSLSSDSIITTEKAREYVDAQDWTEQSSSEIEPDEKRCLNQIMQSLIRLPSGDISVAELIMGYKTEFKLEYDDTLKRYGIKYDADEGLIYISDSHQGIKKLLHGSSWEKSWGRILKRIPDAVASSGIRFSSIVTRATGIPWVKMFDN